MFSSWFIINTMIGVIVEVRLLWKSLPAKLLLSCVFCSVWKCFKWITLTHIDFGCLFSDLPSEKSCCWSSGRWFAHMFVSIGSVGLADVLDGFTASTWRTTCGRTTPLKPPLTATWCPSAVSSMRSFGKMFPRGRFVLNCWLMDRMHVKHWLLMHC